MKCSTPTELGKSVVAKEVVDAVVESKEQKQCEQGEGKGSDPDPTLSSEGKVVEKTLVLDEGDESSLVERMLR